MTAVSQTPQPFQPGFRLIDGSALNAALAFSLDASIDGVTASTTQTRAGGTAIVVPQAQVASANVSDAITLCGPQAVAGSINAQGGMLFLIKNSSGQTIQVFPPGASDTIDGGAAGAAVNLATACIGVYMCTKVAGGVATWYSGKMAVSS